MEKIALILLNIMVIAGIVTIPAQFKIVQTLKKNGINSGMFIFLPSDLKKFKNLINSEKDELIRSKMRLTYLSWIIPFIIAITSLISAIFVLMTSD